MASDKLGTFTGVGVGPGPAELLPVGALKSLQSADVIYLPRAKGSEVSVAETALRGLGLKGEAFRYVEFAMLKDRSQLVDHYDQLAEELVGQIRAGQRVAYCTIGDPMTYATYGYVLAAIRHKAPELPVKTWPGVTSFAALAAKLGFPLGEGKEQLLVAPCPDGQADLRRLIETHDVVVLMKIGKRLPMVLELIAELGIASYCALGHRVGLEGEEILHSLEASSHEELAARSQSRLGYLATMLIRKGPREKRHR